MMTYISQFRDCYVAADWTAGAEAWGKGLTSAVKYRPAPFNIRLSPEFDGNLQVVVHGVDFLPRVHVVDNGNGEYSASYVPTEAGEFKVEIKADGKHICNSPYTVPVSSGGARVFFSAAKTANPAEAIVNIERGLPHNQFNEFTRWVPIDTMPPQVLDQTLQATTGKVRAMVIILDDDQSMAEMAQDGTLSHLIEVARANPLPDTPVPDFSAPARPPVQRIVMPNRTAPPPPPPGYSLPFHFIL